MKHLRTTGMMLIFGAILVCMSFTTKRTTPANAALTRANNPSAMALHPSAKTSASRIHTNHKDVFYYFYDTTDTYVENATADHEEVVLMNATGVLVDENSVGGTLLEEGYTIPGKPHMGFPDIFLYAHFGH
jgi:hypothetical protein